MASRNRSVGHQLERDAVKLLREFFPRAVSSRSESRNRDDQKVDLCHTGFLNVQCKNYSKSLKYTDILDEMPVEEGQMNVIFDRQTRKSASGKRFIKYGEYVHMHLDDFLELIRRIHENTDNTPIGSTPI